MSRFDLASLALRSLAGCWLLWRIGLVDRLTAPPVGVDRPLVGPLDRPPCSIVVPARDEALSLPTLLRSLSGELRAGDEVIVVDDDSGDRTAEAAGDGGATVLRARPVPEGWTGKTSACWTGAASAANEVLVFLDADTEFEAGGLDRLLAAHEARGGLLSVQPFHLVRRPYERLSAFFNVIAMMGVDAFTPLGERRVPSGAFGPVLVTSAADYGSVDGHRSVAGEVLDDVALAREYTRSGRRVTCLGGRGTVRFRMYPDGLGHLVEGWRKNFAGGAAGTRKLTLLLVAAWISLCIEAGWGLAALAWHGGDPPVALAVFGLVAVQLLWMLRRIGTFGMATAVLFPIPLAFFFVLFARSGVDFFFRRRITWKGRELAT